MEPIKAKVTYHVDADDCMIRDDQLIVYLGGGHIAFDLCGLQPTTENVTISLEVILAQPL